MVKGFTCGAFDLLHAGHILMLEECSKHCDYLIVGLQIDPSDRLGKNKPVQSIVERQIQLKAVKWVDEIVVYQTESELETLCSVLDFSVRFVGEEYRDRWFTGKLASEKKGEIIYNKRDHHYSSSELRSRIIYKGYDTLNPLNLQIPDNQINSINLESFHAQPSLFSLDTDLFKNITPITLSTDQINSLLHTPVRI